MRMRERGESEKWKDGRKEDWNARKREDGKGMGVGG